tara:strand:+ start:59 stop:250 length:192 start_codon:yes stop_codon:yes gene_type:complete
MKSTFQIKSAKYVLSPITNENGSIKLTMADDQVFSVPLVEGNLYFDLVTEWAKIDGNSVESAD